MNRPQWKMPSHCLVLFLILSDMIWVHVGRYKFNKKLRLRNRIIGKISAENVEDPNTGEAVLKKGEKITRKTADLLESLRIQELKIELPEDRAEARLRGESRPRIVKIVSNGYSEEPGPEGNRTEKHITVEDIVAAVNYFVNLSYGVGEVDDIDHLGNRRLRSVGELLQNQFRIGLSRMERVVKERMTIQDVDTITPQVL